MGGWAVDGRAGGISQGPLGPACALPHPGAAPTTVDAAPTGQVCAEQSLPKAAWMNEPARPRTLTVAASALWGAPACLAWAE